MNHLQKRPVAAGRSDRAEQVVRRERCNVSSSLPSPLVRLPNVIRARYDADCLAAHTAYQHLAAAQRLLAGQQP